MKNKNKIINMGIKNINDFIKKYDLEYEYIVIFKNSKKKQPFLVNQHIKDINDPRILETLDRYENSEIYFNINLKKSKISVIDIDQDVDLNDLFLKFPDLKNTYYTLGNSKGFHFYIKNDLNLKQNFVDVLKDDIIGDFININIWERVDKNVFSSDLNFLNQDQIYNIVIKEKVQKIKKEDIQDNQDNQENQENQENQDIQEEFTGNIDELCEIVDNIPKRYADNYNDWIKILSIFKKYNLYDLAKNFSKKSKKYSETDFNKTYNNIFLWSFSINTIYYYSKENKTRYYKIIEKYKKLEREKKEEESENKEQENYSLKKKEFEEDNFKIVKKNCYYIFNKYKNIYESKSEKELKEMYRHFSYEGYINDKLVDKSFINKWINDKNIKNYIDADIFPNDNLCPKDYFNNWTGFAVENFSDEGIKSENDDDLDFILNHIKILCNNNIDVYNYFIKWLSHLFQYPEEKIGIMILFISREGTGKGLFISLIKKMLGSDKVLISNNCKEEVFGKFNDLMNNKILVDLEELHFLDSCATTDLLKGYITEDTISIQEKGKKIFKVNSYHRFIATSNNDIPINTGDEDRRKLIIECSNELIKNTEYFEKLVNIIEDKSSQKKFYNFLKNQEIKNFYSCDSKNIPKTEYHEDLKEYFTDTIKDFYNDLILDLYDTKEDNIYNNVLYQKYNVYCDNNGINKITNKKFILKFNNFIKSETGIIKKRVSSGYIYKFDFDILKNFINDNSQLCID